MFNQNFRKKIIFNKCLIEEILKIKKIFILKIQKLLRGKIDSYLNKIKFCGLTKFVKLMNQRLNKNKYIIVEEPY